MRIWKWLQDTAIRTMQFVMWILGMGCVGLATTLIAGISFLWFTRVLPTLLDLSSFPGLLQFFISTWLTFNAMWNHYHASTVHPGEPSSEYLPPLEPQERDMRRQGDELWARFCKVCWQWKPPRTHHCHFCNKCVLKMDHHCPWVNNCVGHHNQKFFMNMLIYIFLATVHINTIIGLYYIGYLIPYQPHNIPAVEKLIMWIYTLCVVLIVMISVFNVWNGYLLYSNQTVIEFYGNRQSASEAKKGGRLWRPPFNLGKFANLQEVYGYYSSLWMMLMPTTELLSTNGHEYTTIFGLATVTNPTGRRQQDDYESDSDIRLVG